MANSIFYVPTTTGEQAVTGSDNAVSSWGLNFGGTNGGLGSGSSFGLQMPATQSTQWGFTMPSNADLNGLNAYSNIDAITPIGTTYQDQLSTLGGAQSAATQGIDWGKSLGIGVQGLQALAGLWTAYNGTQSLKLAKSAYNTQKDLAYKNLGNSIKSYNTALSDRLRARAAMETGDKNAYDDQIEENKLKD